MQKFNITLYRKAIIFWILFPMPFVVLNFLFDSLPMKYAFGAEETIGLFLYLSFYILIFTIPFSFIATLFGLVGLLVSFRIDKKLLITTLIGLLFMAMIFYRYILR